MKLCTLIRTNAIVFALAIALAVPTVIGAVWYTKLLQTNEIKAQLHAHYLATLFASSDRQVSALQDIVLSGTSMRDDTTRVRVIDTGGEVITEWGPAISGFSVVATSPIIVMGRVTGQVETSAGAAALLYTMLVHVVLNSVVAAVA